MEWLEVISLWVLLMLALYGCACGVYQSTCAVLRPREPCVKLIVSTNGDTDAIEQHLRYAYALSKGWNIPLVVTDDGMDAETRVIVEKLLTEYGLDFIPVKAENACIVNTSCV